MILRIALAYAPAWFCILASFCIYVRSGYEIFRKRQQLRAFSAIPGNTPPVENPFTDFKTTEIEITSELAILQASDPELPRVYFRANDQRAKNRCETPSLGQDYGAYTVTIDSSSSRRPRSETRISIPPQTPRTTQHRKNRMAIEANTAAWAYTKVAILFFISLLVTWVRTFLSLMSDQRAK